MKHRITGVDAGSIAAELDIGEGWLLTDINGEDVADVIDYEYAASAERLTLGLESPAGERVEAVVDKPMYEPLGFSFESGLMSPVRTCKNHCLFCFIDQMPGGVRDTLHFKDDDWRMSLIMGNYVTLTNVDTPEFERIIARRISPLYISVHALEPELRVKLMRNPTAGELASRLARLKSAGLSFHSQIVLCPGLNDGSALINTLDGLYALRPEAASVAIVPVGLTKYRQGLHPLRNVTPEEAKELILLIRKYQQKSLAEYGDRFVYGADELYLTAGAELPGYDEYDGFDQLENGVGLLRRFEDGFNYALEDKRPLKCGASFISASGVLAAPFMQTLFDRLEPYGIKIDVQVMQNDYFGHSVTVSGLICGCDLESQLKYKADAPLLIPRSMLRECEDVFLDGTTLKQLQTALNTRVAPMPAFDGEDFIEELFALCKE